MIEKYDLRLSVLIFLNEDVSGMGIAVDVAKLEDHLRVHLADLGRDGVRIDPMSAEVLDVVNMAAWKKRKPRN